MSFFRSTDVHQSLRIHDDDIAGLEPAVGRERLAGLFLAIPVAGEHLLPRSHFGVGQFVAESSVVAPDVGEICLVVTAQRPTSRDSGDLPKRGRNAVDAAVAVGKPCRTDQCRFAPVDLGARIPG
jgi:hypothetical protein